MVFPVIGDVVVIRCTKWTPDFDAEMHIMETMYTLGGETLRDGEAETLFPRARKKGQRFWFQDNPYKLEMVVEKVGQISVFARKATVN